jgi:putative MATE family efflux protein
VQDLTQGSVPRHLVRLATPLAAGMVFQTMYFLVDLWFVARLGDAAIAGVGAAGNVQFIVMALTQILGVGTMALIAHAVGRRDLADANLVFNQSLLLAACCAVLTLVAGYALAPLYMGSLGASAETVAAGSTYLRWFIPGLALQFALVSIGSALRGTGVTKPTMVVQVVSVVLNALLAPVLIGGWLTGRPLGVAGAGLATSIAVAVGVLLMLAYFARLEKLVRFDPAMFRARLVVWGRILKIGLPPGGEFALMFLYMAVVYRITRQFGSEAQAGFGIGVRLMQAIFLPAMAIAFAAAPIAGQNFGARRPERVRETFRWAAVQSSVVMLVLTILCQWRAESLVHAFSSEPRVVAVGGEYLRIIAWNFVATGLIFTSSGMFQALGNTLPGFLSGATRLVTFAGPGLWMATRPGFALHDLWILSVLTVTLQALASLWLVRREFRLRLGALERTQAPAATPVPVPVAPGVDG